ncbi:MAG: putative phage abortive infection protein [Fulvivirga sp.]
MVVLFFPYWLTQFNLFEFGFSDKPGEIGDAIGGTIGPFVAIAAAILTFFAFWVQYKANEQQKTDLKIERFENKFYELLRLHRSNLDEMNISDRVVGRKCFIRLFNELRYCYMIVNDQYESGSEADKKLYERHHIDKLTFAYTIFFYGIGINSEKQFLNNFNEAEKNLYKDCKKVMIKYQEKYVKCKQNKPDLRYYTMDIPVSNDENERTKVFYYQPFDGHADRLGHYFRHLFQTVKYIEEQKESLLDSKLKYSYIKTLRAQLSNHEQLMLYYNSSAWFSDKWKLFFTEYRLIKNLPLGLADFGIKPEEKYKEDIANLRARGIQMFE